MADSSATSDDKLFAALAWVFTPLVPIILMLIEDKKNRPFIKEHYMQALVWGIVVVIAYFILTAVTFGIFFLCGWLLWIPQLYWAYQAFQGKSVNIPGITDFVKKQGWG
jgi:uncharacterized membrane protein